MQPLDKIMCYDRRRGRFGLWVGIGVALCSAVVNIRSVSNDNIPNVLLPISVLREADLELSEFRPLIEGYRDRVCYWAVRTDHGIYSRYPIWTGVVAAPFFAPIAYFGPAAPGERLLLQAGRLVAIIASGLFAGILATTLRRHVANQWAAGLTLLAVLGTTLQYQLGSNLSNQTLPILCMAGVIALVCVKEMTASGAVVAGLLAGLAVASRAPAAFAAIAPLGVFLSRREWRRYSPLTAAGAAVFPALTLLYQRAAFGGWFQTGYGDEPGAGFNAPMLSGLMGLLFSPTCGLLVYSPWLTAGFVGAWRCVRGRGASAASSEAGRWLFAGFVGQWLLFSRWWAWNGALTFGGARMLSETIPALVMLIALGGMLPASVPEESPESGTTASRNSLWIAILGAVAVLHFLIGTVCYDAIAPSNPTKPDWDISRDFVALFFAKAGLESGLKEIVTALGALAVTLAAVGFMLRRMLRPIGMPAASSQVSVQSDRNA